ARGTRDLRQAIQALCVVPAARVDVRTDAGAPVLAAIGGARAGRLSGRATAGARRDALLRSPCRLLFRDGEPRRRGAGGALLAGPCLRAAEPRASPNSRRVRARAPPLRSRGPLQRRRKRRQLLGA